LNNYCVLIELSKKILVIFAITYFFGNPYFYVEFLREN